MRGKPTMIKKKQAMKNEVSHRDTQAILEANATFYNAFSTLDYTAMEDLWLPDNSSICVFPSSKPLHGFGAILKSWQHAVESMDGNELRNWMAPDDVRFEYLGTNKATIVCDELIFFTSSRVVRGNVFKQTDVVNKFQARNMFKKVNNRWYLCYHEAKAVKTNEDYLGLSQSSSEDSTSTFLTLMTSKAERKRDRNDAFSAFLTWGCQPFNCAGGVP
jgi:SnoaL-like domain